MIKKKNQPTGVTFNLKEQSRENWSVQLKQGKKENCNNLSDLSFWLNPYPDPNQIIPDPDSQLRKKAHNLAGIQRTVCAEASFSTCPRL